MTSDEDDEQPSAGARTIKPGWWVAITVRPDAAPLRAYVGQVQDVDAYGIRITLIDWLMGSATGWDFFAPWTMVQSALIATEEHELSLFGDDAAGWQKRMRGEESEALVEMLDEQIEETEDDDERSSLTSLRDALNNVGQSVASSLLSAYLKRMTGMGGPAG